MSPLRNANHEVLVARSYITLLGVKFQDNLQWKSQIYGKGGVVSALHSRFYIIRRLRSHLSMKSFKKIVDGLFMSKIRYGLQLYGKVRIEEEDPKCEDFKAIQKIQNDMLRFLASCKIKDKVSIKSLLEKFSFFTNNQLNAQIKLMEVWKALNTDNYPLQITQRVSSNDVVTTRAAARGRHCEIGRSNLTQNTCVSEFGIWHPLLSPTVQLFTEPKKNLRNL